MLLLLFYSGTDAFAIDTQYIKEIVPRIKTNQEQNRPQFLSGICELHGDIFPIVDFNRLLTGTPCENTFYTRTIIVTNPHSSSSLPHLGITGEKVCDTRECAFKQFSPSKHYPNQLPFLNHMGKIDGEMVAWVDIPLLFKTVSIQKEGIFSGS